MHCVKYGRIKFKSCIMCRINSKYALFKALSSGRNERNILISTVLLLLFIMYPESTDYHQGEKKNSTE